jgi:predicted metalloendopeptidase
LNKLSKGSDKQSDICTTTACQTAGKLIRDNINSSVDPCDDFYDFACGGWMATHTIPPEKSRTSTFDELSEELQKKLKEELNEPSKVGDADSVIYALDLFKACIDNGMNYDKNFSSFVSYSEITQKKIILDIVHYFLAENTAFTH